MATISGAFQAVGNTVGTLYQRARGCFQRRQVSIQEENIPEMCTICRSEWEGTSDRVKTTCGHYFHEDCLNQWISSDAGHNTCPNCRVINPLGQSNPQNMPDPATHQYSSAVREISILSYSGFGLAGSMVALDFLGNIIGRLVAQNSEGLELEPMQLAVLTGALTFGISQFLASKDLLGTASEMLEEGNQIKSEASIQALRAMKGFSTPISSIMSLTLAANLYAGSDFNLPKLMNKLVFFGALYAGAFAFSIASSYERAITQGVSKISTWVQRHLPAL